MVAVWSLLNVGTTVSDSGASVLDTHAIVDW